MAHAELGPPLRWSWAGSTGVGGVAAQAHACARRSQRGERLRSSLIQRKRGAALVFSFEAEEASGKNCSSRLGARRTQADGAGLRRGQQGKDGGDRTRERARQQLGSDLAAGASLGSRGQPWPRVLRCDDDGEAAASSVGRRQIRRRGGPRRCSPTKRRRGDGSGEDEEAGGAGGPLQRGRGGSRRGRKNWRRGGRVRWVAAPRLARRDGLARR